MPTSNPLVGPLTARLARIFFDFTDAHAAAVEKFVSEREGPIVDKMIGFLDSHFDRSTIQARMAAGPILGTLRNMKPDIEVSIDATIDYGFELLEKYLLSVAKAGGGA